MEEANEEGEDVEEDLEDDDEYTETLLPCKDDIPEVEAELRERFNSAAQAGEIDLSDPTA